MYRLDHDPRTGVLHITVEGFWDLGTAATFGAAAVAKGAGIRLRHGHYAIFADARAMSIQAGPVADAIGLLLPKARLLTNGPIAIVSGAMLNKMQIDRILTSDRLRTFLSMQEAEAWLEAEWIGRRAA